MALVLIITVPLVGSLAYGLWMASRLGLLSLWPRRQAAPRPVRTVAAERR